MKEDMSLSNLGTVALHAAKVPTNVFSSTLICILTLDYCINGVSVMLYMSFGQDDVLTNPVNDVSADPEEGTGVLTPAPWKIRNSIGLYRNMQLYPLPLGKVGPP